MRSSLTSLLLCLSTISCGGGGTTCGPGGAPANGIVAGDATITLTYGGLTSGANNDCPGSTSSSVVSLTLAGTQTDGSGFITLCIPHPDQLGAGQPLGGDVPGADPVHVVDVEGSSGGCTFSLATATAPTGTAQATGLCSNGTDSRGFALELDGQISLTRCCGGGTPGACTGTEDTVGVTLTGQTAVVPLL